MAITYQSKLAKDVVVGDRIQWQVQGPKYSWQSKNKSAVVIGIIKESDRYQFVFKSALPYTVSKLDAWGHDSYVAVAEKLTPVPFNVGQTVMDRHGDLYEVTRVGDKTITVKPLDKNGWAWATKRAEPTNYVPKDNKLRAELLAAEQEVKRIQIAIDKLENDQYRAQMSINPQWNAAAEAVHPNYNSWE